LSEKSIEESSCIFCRIVSGQIPADRVHDDGEIIAIKDVNPQAPTHLLVIPHRHIKGVGDLDDQALMGKLFMVAARQGGLLEKGFRLVVNNGNEGGQTVDHLHVHVLGGRQLTWPPG
jgi:histidine triad (HIT) family protein